MFMDTRVRRIFVEKKKGCGIEADKLLYDLKENLNVKSIKSLRIVNRYDISGLSDEEYELSRCTVFSEPPVDNVYDETIDMGNGRAFASEYLPGQYDQRADSASQCLQILTMGERPIVRAARLILLEGDISDEDFKKIKAYCINSVDSREAFRSSR
jgi:phosphoribosylformylglycinamidine synthase